MMAEGPITMVRGRSWLSFAVSGCLHGCVLAWVILGGARQPPERAQSIYDREIRPYEKKIVWYSLQEKLPEIAPADTQAGARPPRASAKAPQTMVAGARDDARPAPLIWAPEPEVAAPKEVPLPNVVAVTPPKVVRPFLSPPVKAPVVPPVAPLQDAPNVTAADLRPALPLPALKPKVVRPFLEPDAKAPAKPVAAALPDAPNVAVADLKPALPLPALKPKVVRPFLEPSVKAPAPPPVAPLEDAPNVAATDLKPALSLPEVTPSGPRRAFAPPPNVRMQRQAMLPLPEGPQPEMVVEPNALPFPGAGPRPQARAFTAPPAKPRAVTAAAVLPEAPSVSAVSAPKAGLDKVPRGYSPPRLPARPEAAPAINAEPPAVSPVPGPMSGVSLAIVGLNPANTTKVPAPPASRAAGFSAGPEPRAEGDTGARSFALVNVPGLVVSSGSKDSQPTIAATFSPTSRENLLAAARVSKGAAPKVPVELGGAYAASPDPRFAGRVVYTMAVQMPNVTSFSGSWLVWFAERVPDPGSSPGAAPREMRPPEVVRKVDPKYVAAAAADRVEGTVRLFGVIGKDGHVGGIALLRQLDDRLDRSAQEALAKWEFTPALRDGVAVDVDAIFEIPFHLAPRPKPLPKP
jgi:TonB family protein